jgi:small multidrug resistance pump
MHWLYLALAIILEVIGTTFMKISDGFTKLWPSVATTVTYIASVVFLALSLKKIDVSISYAIWAGLGTALIAVVGIVYFKEPVNAIKIISVVLIIIGVVGLNLSFNGHV